MDFILTNGIVYTMDGRKEQAVAIKGEQIAAVGSNEEILMLRSPSTTLIDLEGKCVLPGFTDSHTHLLLTGLVNDRLDLRGVASPEDIIRLGRDYIKAKNKQPGEWIVGYGFDHNIFENPVLPDGAIAEQISSEHPVLIDRICGHVGAANSLALKLVGYNDDTQISGGVLDKDSSGHLNGILREAALDWFKSQIPKGGIEEIERVILETGKHFASLGLTCVHTDDLEGADLDVLLKAYDNLIKSGELPVRVYEEVQAANPSRLNKFLAKGLRTGDGNSFFKIGNIKLLTDGSLGARTAYLREDYSDDAGNIGTPVYTQESLNEVVELAHNSGMQVAFHAIGDGAIEQCINAVEKAVKHNPKELRHRIVHCQIADLNLYRRMAKLGIAADIQPSFAVSDRELVFPRLGREREVSSYAWKTMLDLGIHMGGGSDCPVESCDPLWGIYCAVTRKDEHGEPQNGWHPEQCLTIEEAVKLYTTEAAYLSFEEDIKGTLAEGKLADLVVLSKDIFSIDPSEILNTKVVMTMVGGRISYQQ